MKVKCRLFIDVTSEAIAKLVQDVLKVDNAGYLETRLLNKGIEALIETDDLLSLLNTLNDFCSCLSLAISVLSETENS